MAYSSWSVVFSEQPSAAKWNILGTNDASFNDGTGIGDDTIDSRHYAAGSIDYEHFGADSGVYQVLADVTLGSTGTTIDSGTITARSFVKFIAFVNPTGGTLNVGIRFNSDSGSNYADRSSNNGGADATGVSSANIFTKTAVDANPQIIIGEFYNLAAAEKLVDFRSSIRGSAGAASAPDRKEGMGKWTNTSSQVTSVQIVDIGGTGDMAAGSRLLVLGR